MTKLPGNRSTIPSVKTVFAYSLLSRVLVAGFVLAVSLPLITILAFLLQNFPGPGELGPLLIALLFVLVPPVFVLLRFGHYFRRFEVQPRYLVVATLWFRWDLEWRDITRVMRRTRLGRWGASAFRVRVKMEIQPGREEWMDLFDSSLPDADQLYTQLLQHVPHVSAADIKDDLPFPGDSR